MGSHHHHHYPHSHDASQPASSTLRNLYWAFALNFSFTIVELIGGQYFASYAILTDALHDFGDSLAILMSIILEKISHRKATDVFSYGYRRLSLLSALLTSAVLSIGTVYMLTQAIPRLWYPGEPHGLGMMGLAVLGIVVNGIPAWKLWNGATLNERSVSWHLLEDVLGWVLVLVGGAAIALWNWTIVDPILSIVFSGLIFFGIGRNLWSIGKLFLQGVPSELQVDSFTAKILEVAGVADVHDVHAWSLDGAHHVVSMHVVVNSDLRVMETANIKHQIRDILKNFGSIHLTVEIEHQSEHCDASDCGKAHSPDAHPSHDHHHHHEGL